MDPFELICHHTYATFDGLPIDLSDYNCHGRARGATHLADGASAGSGALNFTGADRVHVPISQVWKKLGGLKVEVTARLNGPRANPRVFIRGMQSFAFYCWNARLAVICTTANPVNPGGATDGLTAATVPLSQWATWGFVHNGLDTLELYVDGQLVARRTDLLGGVAGVSDEGIYIGTGGNYLSHVLDGAIDEVKVWRLNPTLVDAAFLSRPMDRAAADCLDAFLRCLAAAVEREPECGRRMCQAIEGATDRALRAIASAGPETRARLDWTSRRYLQLWQQGRLDSPEMAQLFTDWCAWLQMTGLALDDRELAEFLQSECFKKLLSDCPTLECDPAFKALQKAVAGACRSASPSADRA